MTKLGKNSIITAKIETGKSMENMTEKENIIHIYIFK